MRILVLLLLLSVVSVTLGRVMEKTEEIADAIEKQGCVMFLFFFKTYTSSIYFHLLRTVLLW